MASEAYENNYNHYKYFYKNQPLAVYCRNNGLSYQRVLRWIRTLGYSIEDAVEKQDFNMRAASINHKYMIDGQPAFQILSHRQYLRFRRLIAKGLSSEDAYKKIKEKE